MLPPTTKDSTGISVKETEKVRERHHWGAFSQIAPDTFSFCGWGRNLERRVSVKRLLSWLLELTEGF